MSDENVGKTIAEATPIIFRDIIVAATIDKDPPSASINRTGEFTADLSVGSESQKSVIDRMYGYINDLVTEAAKQHKTDNFNDDSSDILPGKKNNITRLITNEFFFYTKKPLSITEFQELQQKIADLARMQPENLQLVLGSFAVRTEDNKIMNVVAHVECGTNPQVNFIVKNHPSPVDPVYYDIANNSKIILPNVDIEKSDTLASTIKINGVGECAFSYNNISQRKTAGGASYYSCVDICLDHDKGVGKTYLNQQLDAAVKKTTLTEQTEPLPTQCSHIVVSNFASLNRHNTLGVITHADPVASYHKLSSEPKASTSMPNIQFGTPANVIVAPATVCGKLPLYEQSKIIQSNKPFKKIYDNAIYEDLREKYPAAFIQDMEALSWDSPVSYEYHKQIKVLVDRMEQLAEPTDENIKSVINEWYPTLTLQQQRQFKGNYDYLVHDLKDDYQYELRQVISIRKANVSKEYREDVQKLMKDIYNLYNPDNLMIMETIAKWKWEIAPNCRMKFDEDLPQIIKGIAKNNNFLPPASLPPEPTEKSLFIDTIQGRYPKYFSDPPPRDPSEADYHNKIKMLVSEIQQLNNPSRTEIEGALDQWFSKITLEQQNQFRGEMPFLVNDAKSVYLDEISEQYRSAFRNLNKLNPVDKEYHEEVINLMKKIHGLYNPLVKDIQAAIQEWRSGISTDKQARFDKDLPDILLKQNANPAPSTPKELTNQYREAISHIKQVASPEITPDADNPTFSPR